MNIKDVCFDNFLELDIDEQNEIFENFDLLKELVKKNNISDKRYLHSLSVADVSQDLASYHNVDKHQAYLAGLLHDVCKFKDSSSSGYLEKILSKYEPNKLNGITGAYHSWAAYYYLKEKTNFNDEIVLKAIYNHTVCLDDNPLSLILYIADKREPLRKISDNALEIAKYDLIKAKEIIDVSTKKYLEEKNEKYFGNCL